MKCEYIKKSLPLYYYNELDRATVSQIKTHLRTCRDCREEFTTLKNTLTLVHRKANINLPFTYRRALFRKMYDTIPQQETRRVLIRKPVFALSAAFTAAVVLCFVFLIRQSTSPTGMDWENYPFVYNVEKLETSMFELDQEISEEALQLYTFDEEIERVWQEIDELTDFISI